MKLDDVSEEVGPSQSVLYDPVADSFTLAPNWAREDYYAHIPNETIPYTLTEEVLP